MGVRIILNAAAQKEANIVWIGDGSWLKYPLDLSKARIPALAAVSPKRAMGPLIQGQLFKL
jgi:hypothetical protein